MKLNLHSSLLAFLLLWLIALPAWCSTTKQEYIVPPGFMLQWGFMHFPPLIYLDDNKQAKGDLAELMAAIKSYSGIPYEPMLFPNVRAIFNLNQQKINFAIGAKALVENEKDFFISTFPVAKLQLLILWRKDSPSVTSIDNLTGKRLVLLTGYTYGGLRTKLEKIAGNYNEVENHSRAISALKFKRSDYALVYKTVSEYNLMTTVQKDFDHVIVKEVELYLILNGKVDNAKQIMKRLETALLRYQKTLLTEN